MAALGLEWNCAPSSRAKLKRIFMSSVFESRAPTRVSAAIFRAKATALQLRRAVRDATHGIRRHSRGDINAFSHVWAESRMPLWSETSPAELALQRGKVQNLRCALRRLDGACIPAGECFSFWKQIGQATTRRGYAPGRLLREGCLIPAIGGGLCQLSNALYDVALQADCEIVERWAHSRIVPGSVAQLGRDATVAWNYIDLRFRAPCEIFIEARLTHDELVLRLRSALPRKSGVAVRQIIPLSVVGAVFDVAAHSCATCDANQCFRHSPHAAAPRGATAFLVDENWPEWRVYLAENRTGDDVLALPLDGKRFNQPRYVWDTNGYARIHAATASTLWRGVTARRLGRYGAARLQAQLDGAEMLAGHFAGALCSDVTRVVVAQSLLPWLWKNGHLGGREFEVLMTRLPLTELHRCLDEALTMHPQRRTLGEFRAPAWLAACEAEALQAATRIVTPHTQIAQLFDDRALFLQWHRPPATSPPPGKSVVFPGPTAARKGAYELREVAQELDLEIITLGSELEGDDFWQGVRVRRVETQNPAVWLCDAAVVVQPALVEDAPRALLMALSAGIPVIASPNCGLPEQPGLRFAPYGDVSALQAALETAMCEHS